jgi:peptide/nickel transport system permease protein
MTRQMTKNFRTLPWRGRVEYIKRSLMYLGRGEFSSAAYLTGRFRGITPPPASVALRAALADPPPPGEGKKAPRQPLRLHPAHRHCREAALIRIVAVKFLQAVPVILIIAILAFLLLSLLPGDPATIIAGEQASPAAVEQVRRQLGLDRPLAEQLAIWLTNLARGDFGSSLILHQSVLSAVGERLPVTLSLTVLSISFTLPVGVLLGSIAAYFRRTWIDSAVMTVALLGVSIPAFWIAILGVILFSVQLGWVPSSGFAPLSQGIGPWFSSLALPALILSLFQIGFLARMTRAAMLDVLGQDYIRTARAKGLSEWHTVGKHALRNALILIITAAGILLSAAIGGSVIIEQVFALPGIGRMVVQAILARDYPLVQGTMLILGFSFVVINLLVDILYTLADPRVRHD